MSRSLTVSQARAALAEVVARVEAGEEVTLTRHGRAVAVLVRPDALRSRRSEAAFEEADAIDDLLRRARSTSLEESPTIARHRADALVAEVRANRSRR